MNAYGKYISSGIDWIGNIPQHWEIKRIKNVCTFSYGDSLAEEQRIDGEIAVLGSNGQIGLHNESNTEAPCIVVGRKGSFGKVTFSDDKIFAIDTTYYIDKRYTRHSLRWLFYNLDIIELDKFSKDTGVPGLNRNDAYSEKIALPSFKEQLAITNYLNKQTQKIDKLISIKKEQIEKLRELRHIEINKAVTRGLNPDVKLIESEIDWLGRIPIHWRLTRLKNITLMKSGDSITSENISDNDEYPVYGGNGLRGYTNNYTHEGEYIIVGRQGALCGNINYAIGKFWASEHAVIVTPIKKLNHYWLGELMRTMNLNRYSQSAAQPGLAVEKIQALKIPLPELPEQDKIANYLREQTSKLDNLIKNIENQIVKLQELRKIKIYNAVTGKIKVTANERTTN